MRSLILSTATRFLLPLILLFSVFLFLRGHNEPGGGFIAGLVAASAFALNGLASGTEQARSELRIDPYTLIGAGLLLATCGGLWGLLARQPFLTGVWSELELPWFGELELGTPLLFDLGVYIGVLGVTLNILLAAAEVRS